MAILVHCPSCSRQLRVPDNLLNTQVKCPTCGATFDATGTPEQAITATAVAPSGEAPDDRPWERPEEGHVRRDWEPHRANTVLTLGIISVAIAPLCGLAGLALGIPTWVMGGGDLRKMRARVMDPRG